ncbi:hypothetical protein B0H16DRAFT_1738309 [Mycena metata]|uniref:Uncharacterized protein n=1 Tax=Mycena metata TaxID=1033252 RepID=A0AAD7HIC9_9AGAR|nr:hypothetical protein B0H16DRAFT_1738309 [Mycena metata]
MLPLPPLHPPESLTNPSPQIFFADPHGSWRWADARHKRPMGSIVLDPGVKEMLLGNARDFLASEKLVLVVILPHLILLCTLFPLVVVVFVMNRPPALPSPPPFLGHRHPKAHLAHLYVLLLHLMYLVPGRGTQRRC